MNNKFIEQQKESYKKCMVNFIEWYLNNSYDVPMLREWLFNGTNLEMLNEKINKLNNSIFNSRQDFEILKNEIIILIELLNKYCKIEKIMTGVADNKNYRYIQSYKYDLYTKEQGYFNYTLVEEKDDTHSFEIENEKVKNFTVDLEHHYFINIEYYSNSEINYKKAINFIKGKYGDKEQKYFKLDDVMQEIKNIFNITYKDFKDIILKRMIDNKQIKLIKVPCSHHKRIRFYYNNINYSVNSFCILS